ncbi:hypothetical protein RD792_005530 [Penstemon davidsonii]|uniref:Pectinesterase n=1 Tax=Penstemon davidsonii TaxID=160366 RepID=A0ABR0DEX8_9LAMI|nr:hypothetical protein RD792_005530 [Penstemon davidsonii]
MVSKKIAIIATSTLLLVAVVATLAVTIISANKNNTNSSKPNHDETHTSQKAIQDLCQNTYYQQTCLNSLTKASNSTDPKTLIKVSFQEAIKELSNVINKSTPLQKASKDPETVEAYKICQKLLDDSMNDLHKSVDRFDSFDMSNFSKFVDDIKTWLTGALTYQDTCMDCFEGTKGEAGQEMQQLLKDSRELTVNGLALVTEFSKFFGFGSRRLMDDIGFHIDRSPIDYDYVFRKVDAVTNKLNPMGSKNRKLLETPVDYDYGVRKLLQAPIDYDYVVRKMEGLTDELKPNATGTRNLLQATSNAIKPNVIVAKDGSGKYTSINEALRDVPNDNKDVFIVYIKEGVYEEYVVVEKTMKNVMFIGDGPKKTKITGNKSKVGGLGTFLTATVVVEGDRFIAKDIGFENSAGAIMHQAVALRVTADESIFHNCQIDGHQDTLYAHNHRQFYRDCTISGTIDFIFGNARVVLQNCTLLVRKPLDNQKLCMVTAHGRTLLNQTSAIVLQNCRIVPDADYPVNDNTYKTFLGRPWKEFSRTIVMDSELGSLIHPEGWSAWNNTNAHLDSCWYAEVNNKGPGSDLAGRVKWGGIKTISIEEAEGYAPALFYDGGDWIAGKGIPYDGGLMKS